MEKQKEYKRIAYLQVDKVDRLEDRNHGKREIKENNLDQPDNSFLFFFCYDYIFIQKNSQVTIK